MTEKVNGSGTVSAVRWIDQCNVLNELIENGHEVAAKIIGSRPTDMSDTKTPDQCLAATLGVALDRAINEMQTLNAQLIRIADRF